jgi:hypothetical protein
MSAIVVFSQIRRDKGIALPVENPAGKEDCKEERLVEV